MKKFIIVIFSFLIVKVTRSQTVQEIKRDIYYDRYEGAKKKLVSILKSNQENLEALYWLGEIYLYQGKIDSARKIYMNGAGPTLQNEFSRKISPLIYIGWSHLLLDSGRAEAARTQMESILRETKSKNVEVLMAIARANI